MKVMIMGEPKFYKKIIVVIVFIVLFIGISLLYSFLSLLFEPTSITIYPESGTYNPRNDTNPDKEIITLNYNELLAEKALLFIPLDIERLTEIGYKIIADADVFVYFLTSEKDYKELVDLSDSEISYYDLCGSSSAKAEFKASCNVDKGGLLIINPQDTLVNIFVNVEMRSTPNDVDAVITSDVSNIFRFGNALYSIQSKENKKEYIGTTLSNCYPNYKYPERYSFNSEKLLFNNALICWGDSCKDKKIINSVLSKFNAVTSIDMNNYYPKGLEFRFQGGFDVCETIHSSGAYADLENGVVCLNIKNMKASKGNYRDATISHELIHFLTYPMDIPPSFDEGLAEVISKTVSGDINGFCDESLKHATAYSKYGDNSMYNRGENLFYRLCKEGKGKGQNNFNIEDVNDFFIKVNSLCQENGVLNLGDVKCIIDEFLDVDPNASEQIFNEALFVEEEKPFLDMIYDCSN